MAISKRRFFVGILVILAVAVCLAEAIENSEYCVLCGSVRREKYLLVGPGTLTRDRADPKAGGLAFVYSSDRREGVMALVLPRHEHIYHTRHANGRTIWGGNWARCGDWMSSPDYFAGVWMKTFVEKVTREHPELSPANPPDAGLSRRNQALRLLASTAEIHFNPEVVALIEADPEAPNQDAP